ncbi:hypothetical protein BrE312_0567 [Brenneria sp. EniD312]|nr:hypothetical protein BrE312_0567 [Brenneria sp. EniD312]
MTLNKAYRQFTVAGREDALLIPSAVVFFVRLRGYSLV